jgi:hypothetical protein
VLQTSLRVPHRPKRSTRPAILFRDAKPALRRRRKIVAVAIAGRLRPWQIAAERRHARPFDRPGVPLDKHTPLRFRPRRRKLNRATRCAAQADCWESRPCDHAYHSYRTNVGYRYCQERGCFVRKPPASHNGTYATEQQDAENADYVPRSGTVHGLRGPSPMGAGLSHPLIF